MSRFLRNLAARSLRPTLGIRPRVLPRFADYEKPDESESEILSSPETTSNRTNRSQLKEFEPPGTFRAPEIPEERSLTFPLEVPTREFAAPQPKNDTRFTPGATLREPDMHTTHAESPGEKDFDLPPSPESFPARERSPASKKSPVQRQVNEPTIQPRYEQPRVPAQQKTPAAANGSIPSKPELPVFSFDELAGAAAIPSALVARLSRPENPVAEAAPPETGSVAFQTQAAPADADSKRAIGGRSNVRGRQQSRTWQRMNDPVAPVAEPDVYVTIGRVEVRATNAGSTTEKKAKGAPSLQLAEYLKRRDGSGGQ